MKINSYKIIILVSGIMIGFFIINNVGLSNKVVNFSLNSYEYKRAVEEKINLNSEIENIENDNINMKYKIRSYKGTNTAKTEKLVEDMKSQLKDYGNIVGINAVKGAGIVIKIKDGDINTKLDTNYNIWRKILHDSDIAMVLNEIRKTSAEAILLNEHRVIPNTGVNCYWAFIRFDDQTNEEGPYYLYVIGDPDEMYASVTVEDSYLKELTRRGITVEIEKRDEIIIPQTKQNTEVQFMERYDAN